MKLSVGCPVRIAHDSKLHDAKYRDLRIQHAFEHSPDGKLTPRSRFIAIIASGLVAIVALGAASRPIFAFACDRDVLRVGCHVPTYPKLTTARQGTSAADAASP